jgi:hypothetical protein
LRPAIEQGVLVRKFPTTQQTVPANRRGVSTLDYALVLGVVMPLAVIVVPTSIRMARAAYEMVVVMIAWPFL